MDVWKKKNPGKEVPPLGSQRVLDKSGKFIAKEGVWELVGEEGVHQFEKFAEASVKTTATLDSGEFVLSSDQQSRKHDVASKSLLEFKDVIFLFVILLLEQRTQTSRQKQT